MSKQLDSRSRFLSLVLRHKPEAIGLVLDTEGWASVDRLIELANTHGTTLSRELLEEIVASNEKQRFALSADGARIRANQGHSLEVDLKLEVRQPPEVLHHGTATRFIEAIRRDGLLPGSRQHVHLSATQATALDIGRRHGKPIVLIVQSGAMHAGGHAFFQSSNGVWLVAAVPREYLTFPEDS